MTDTQWADISEFQRVVNNFYPHQFLCIRSNDGTYRDKHFVQNREWADSAVASGKLLGYIVYYFYRPTRTGLATCKAMVGKPNPRMALMIDVESDGGKVKGNQSATINAEYNEAVAWLGNRAKIIGYGNVSDLNTLWPQKPQGIRLVIAAYGSNPAYPGKFAHQYTSSGNCPPFGSPVDLNSADGMSPAQVATLLGIGGGAAPAPSIPAPAAPTVPKYPGRLLKYPPILNGADVRQWQTQMKKRGWRITVDGSYGPKSVEICKAFQAEKKLGVDGIVGPKTWDATWRAPIT